MMNNTISGYCSLKKTVDYMSFSYLSEFKSADTLKIWKATIFKSVNKLESNTSTTTNTTTNQLISLSPASTKSVSYLFGNSWSLFVTANKIINNGIFKPFNLDILSLFVIVWNKKNDCNINHKINNNNNNNSNIGIDDKCKTSKQRKQLLSINYDTVISTSISNEYEYSYSRTSYTTHRKHSIIISLSPTKSISNTQSITPTDNNNKKIKTSNNIYTENHNKKTIKCNCKCNTDQNKSKASVTEIRNRIPLHKPKKKQWNINAVEFVPAENKILEHPDPRFKFTACDIRNYDEYCREFIKGNEFISNARSSLFKSTKRDNNNNDIWITKQCQNSIKMIQENKIVSLLKLYPYGDIYHSTQSSQVLLTMKMAQHDLSYAVREQCGADLEIPLKYSDLGIKRLIIDIVGCLYKLHSFNYSHLDIKPANIVWLIDNNNININGWRLIDYEMMLYINPVIGFSELKGYCGTIGYSPPEMEPKTSNDPDPNQDPNNSDNSEKETDNIHLINHAADIWSLGISLLEILNGGFNPFSLNENDKKYLANNSEIKDYHYYYKNKLKVDVIQVSLNKLKNDLNNPIPIHIYNLLSNMLQSDPQKRISITDILKNKMFYGNKPILKYENGKYFKKLHISRIPDNYNGDIQEWVQL